jgi:hypothetical protein
MRLVACKCLLFTLICLSSPLFAQTMDERATPASDPSQKYNGVGGGLGASIFNGKPYLLISVKPQYEFWGKLMVAIDGNLRFNTSGKFRREDFNDAYDYLRWINYIRYGHPGEDMYIRLGGISNASLGHGTIVDNYSNNSSYDNRKEGLTGRLDAGFVGVEGLISDILVNKSLMAARGFTRPFQMLPLLGNSWFLSNIQLGTTASLDFDTNATRIIPNHEPYVRHYTVYTGNKKSDSTVIVSDSAKIPSPFSIYGVDAEVKVWQSDNVEGKVYGDYVRIANYNDGLIAGLRTSFLIDSTTFVDLRFERDFYRNKFIPNYYNSFYERERFNDDIPPDDFLTKATKLSDTSGGNGNGFKAGTFLDFSKKIQIGVTYAHLDNIPRSDLLTINLTFPNIWWRFFGAIDYARKSIDGPADYFGFDENTQASLRLSVQPFKALTLTLLARWTWTRDPVTQHVERQTIIEPKFNIVLRL